MPYVKVRAKRGKGVTLKTVKKLIAKSEELKTSIINGVATAVNSVTAIDFSACNVAGGADNNDRVGNLVTPLSVHLKGVITHFGASPLQVIRIMAVWTGSQDLVAADFDLPYNFVDRDTWKGAGRVLMNQQFILQAPGNTGELIEFDRYFDLRKLLPKFLRKQVYIGNLAADIQFGKLTLAFTSNLAPNAGNEPIATFSTNYRYSE